MKKFEPMNSFQIEQLLEKVDMQNQFLKLNTDDANLIRQMRETIYFQQQMASRREKLVYAITHNV